MNKLFLKSSVLSISLLTVMASAAISPALAKIFQAFPGVDPTLIKLVLTLPSLLIIPFSLFCGWLVKRVQKKYILLAGLVIYFAAGVGGAFAHTITQLLIIRAIFGIGVGLIIPLSTSLIADFYEGVERTKTMGYSGSVSHLGGVVFLLVSGWLACISWRLAFAVYGLSLLIFLMILFWLPEPQVKRPAGLVKSKLPFGVYICALLGALMMIAFYAAPTNLAMFIENERQMYTSQTPLFKNKEELAVYLEKGAISEAARESFKNNGIMLSERAKLALVEPGKSWTITDKGKKYVIRKAEGKLIISAEKMGRPGIAGYLLSAMTIVGVLSGIFLAQLMKRTRVYCASIAIFSMAVGYGVLGFTSSLSGVLVSMLCIGFSSGVLMPLLLLEVAKLAPDASRAFAMAVASVGVYLGQFLSPVILKMVSNLAGKGDVFRQQFNFLAFGLFAATVISLGIAIKNRKTGVAVDIQLPHH